MRIVYLFFMLSLVMTACNKKDKEKDPAPTTPIDNGGVDNTPKGTLLVHLHNYIDETEVDAYNIVYQTSAGRKISLSKGQFYLSDFELVKLDGTTYSVKDKNILKLQEAESYQLGDVPVGNYKTIRFKVGLSSTVNASTPAASDLTLNRADMWFGSTAQPDGFVFFNFAGKIDTTVAANAPDADMKPFQYRIGTNAQYKQVVMPDKNYSIVKDQAQYIHMYANCAKLFDGVTLTNSANLSVASPADNSSAVAIKIANNIPNIFVYE